MKRFSLSVLGVSVFAMIPVIAGAAGTYYDGNTYQSANARGGYYSTYGAGRGYGQNQSMMVRNTKTTVTKKAATKQNTASKKNGLQINAALTHEFANWDFEMEKAGSKLRYDGVAWNVVSADGVYYFDTSTPVQINFGARYGKQFGETSMIDDDISREGMWEVPAGWTESAITGKPALSVGTSKGGTQTGFNASIGLTNFMSLGRAKITPSVGYRYFKHKLKTNKNYGLMIQVLDTESYINCIEVQPGEIQCSPFVGFVNGSGQTIGYGGFATTTDTNGNTVVVPIVYNNTSAPILDLGNTYYYEQSGTSHSYETVWAGPYVALDMEYAINATNNVTAGIELGLPMYDSKGDQPYRVDWDHPTSVEDKGGFGDAYHLGMNAMWSTAVTDSVMLSFGMTYDYYNVKKADATTYYSQSYYKGNVSELETMIAYMQAHPSEFDTATLDFYNEALNNARDDVAYLDSVGWKIESKDEIKSIYSSMGIRLGLNVKF